MANNTDWLNISQMTGGTGETALSLTALTNSSLQPKTATITARNTQYNVSDTTTVTIQGFQPTLTLSRSTLRFDSTGGTATFTVYSNTAWTINFPALVHSYSTSAGTGDTEVTVVLAPNPDMVSKVEVGTVQDIFGVNQLYLTIVQESFIVELTVTPDDDIVFANTGSSTSVTIDCNAEWEIDYPDWVVPSVVSGGSGTTTVTFTAGENGPTDRSGEITVYAGSKEVVINVLQPFYIPDHLVVTPTAYTFPYSASSTVFVVDSYPEWSIVDITTGQTTWGEDIALTLYMTISDSAIPYTMNLGQSGVIINGVVNNSSSYVFRNGGNYSLEYPFASTTLPVLSGNPFITEIIIGDSIENIPESGFLACTSLSSVTIGSGVTYVESRAFKDCEQLKQINSDAIIAPSKGLNVFEGVATGGTLNYPAGSDYSSWLSIEKDELGYYDWNNAIEEAFVNGQLENFATITYNVTSTSGETKILSNSNSIFGIKEGDKITVFEGDSDTGYTFSSTGKQSLDFYAITGAKHYLYIASCNTITDLVLNDVSNQSVTLSCNDTTSITAMTLNQETDGTYRYSLLKNLKRYEIGGKVATPLVTVKEQARMSALTELVISSTALTALPEYSFYQAGRLSSVTITGSLQNIGQYSFCGCTALQEIVLPSSIKSIGNYCFQNTGFRNITIPDTVQSVGVGCFSNCAQLSAATVGSGLNSIPGYCFQYCTILSDITIKEGITSIGYRAFTRCDSLSSITIPNSVVTMDGGVFMKYSGYTQALSSIIIGSGLTSVGSSCFDGCSLLNSITITAPTAPRLVTSNPFNGISATGTLYYPAGSDYSTWFSKLPSNWTGQEI